MGSAPKVMPILLREKERVASQALENMYSSLFEKFSSEETVFEAPKVCRLMCLALAGQVLAGAGASGSVCRWRVRGVPWGARAW